MKTIKDIKHLEGVRVLVRADFNVPISKGKITDDFRIHAAIPTIHYLHERHAKVILLSHIETKEGENVSLKPVAEYLSKIDCPITFIDNIKEAFQRIENEVGLGGVVLLENLRMLEGEKKNDRKFAAELATLGDIYVNDAFPVSHREHASIVSLPKLLPSYAGLQMEKEVVHLSKTLHPEHPFLFILNGAKFETKLPLLEKFVNIADTIFVGGALSNDFFKLKGYSVGKSLVSEVDIDLSKYLNNPKVMIPIDVVDESRKVWPPSGFPANEKIVDIGPETLRELEKKVKEAKFILWNGPTGLYEAGYNEMTEKLARVIAGATEKGATSVVGGGDTVAAIQKLGLMDKFSFVSTGGGAMLDFLSHGSLPGIDALNESEE